MTSDANADKPRPSAGIDRRRFCRRLAGASAAAGSSLAMMPSLVLPRRAFGIVNADRPTVTDGVASGDVTADSAIIWSRTDRPAAMIVEYDTSDTFRDAKRVIGPAALEVTDFTAKAPLTRLPAAERIFYRVSFQDLSSSRSVSEPVVGSFRTAPADAAEVRFAWSGDTAGQGFGINPDFGGMKIYESIRREAPDFFVHSGDNIYADGPIPAEIELDDGTVWRNVVTEAKS